MITDCEGAWSGDAKKCTAPADRCNGKAAGSAVTGVNTMTFTATKSASLRGKQCPLGAALKSPKVSTAAHDGLLAPQDGLLAPQYCC